MCGRRQDRAPMQLETKFLRLRTPVTLGSRFDDWQVCWLGGWGRYRLYFLVMVVRLPAPLSTQSKAERRIFKNS